MPLLAESQIDTLGLPLRTGIPVRQVRPRSAFHETLTAAFRHDNATLNLLKRFAEPEEERDPDYNPFEDDDLEGFDPVSFSFSRSREETASIKARILQEREDRLTLEQAPLMEEIISRLGAGVTDLLVWVPIGVAAARGRTAVNMLKFGAAAAAGEAVTEVGLQLAQEDRSLTESFGNLAGAALIGGGLGGIAGRFFADDIIGNPSAKKVVRDLENDMEVAAGRELGDEVIPVQLDLFNTEVGGTRQAIQVEAGRRVEAPRAQRGEGVEQRAGAERRAFDQEPSEMAAKDLNAELRDHEFRLLNPEDVTVEQRRTILRAVLDDEKVGASVARLTRDQRNRLASVLRRTRVIDFPAGEPVLLGDVGGEFATQFIAGAGGRVETRGLNVIGAERRVGQQRVAERRAAAERPQRAVREPGVEQRLADVAQEADRGRRAVDVGPGGRILSGEQLDVFTDPIEKTRALIQADVDGMTTDLRAATRTGPETPEAERLAYNAVAERNAAKRTARESLGEIEEDAVQKFSDSAEKIGVDNLESKPLLRAINDELVAARKCLARA